jgi:hypothetical protein
MPSFRPSNLTTEAKNSKSISIISEEVSHEKEAEIIQGEDIY